MANDCEFIDVESAVSLNASKSMIKTPLANMSSISSSRISRTAQNEVITLPPIVEGQVRSSLDSATNRISSGLVKKENSQLFPVNPNPKRWNLSDDENGESSKNRSFNFFTDSMTSLELEGKSTTANKLKKVGTSSTLNSLKSSSIQSRLSTATNSWRRKFIVSSPEVLSGRNSEAASSVFKKSSHHHHHHQQQQKSNLRPSMIRRQATSMSLNNFELFAENHYKMSISSQTTASQIQAMKPTAKPRESPKTTSINESRPLNKKSISLNRLNEIKTETETETSPKNKYISISNRPKTSVVINRNQQSFSNKVIKLGNVNNMQSQSQKTETDNNNNNFGANEKIDRNNTNQRLNEFTLMRILKWLQEIESCNANKTSKPLAISQTNLQDDFYANSNATKDNFDFDISDLDSLDDQVIEYNRVVDKTYNIVHEDSF